MPVNVIGTLKPKNNGKFPVAEAVDIKVSDNLRLDAALEKKADLSSVNFALSGKADNSDIKSLQSQIDEIITPVTQDAEVQNARVGADGTSYQTLKERIDGDIEITDGKIDELSTDTHDVLDKAFSYNLITDSTALEEGVYYDGRNGEKGVEVDYFATDFISVISGETYTMNQTGHACFYDENKQFVSGTLVKQTYDGVVYPATFTIPSGCVYAIFSAHIATENATCIVLGSVEKNYLIGEQHINYEFGTENDYNLPMTSQSIRNIQLKNKLYVNETDIGENCRLYPNGTVMPVEGYRGTSFIGCQASTTYTTSYADSAHVCFYSNTFTFISATLLNQGDYGNEFTTPANCAYFTLALKTSAVPDAFVKEKRYAVSDEAKIYKYIVDASGNGDFTTVNAAVEAADSGDYIFVKAGTYEETVIAASTKVINIVGENKLTTVIFNDHGDYEHSPVLMGGGSLQNITVYAKAPSGTLPANLAYGVHIERQSLANATLLIKDCIIKSELSSALGMGMRGPCDVLLENVDFISTGNREALYFHDSDNDSQLGIQNITVRNCRMLVQAGKKAMLLQSQEKTGSMVYVTFQNNYLFPQSTGVSYVNWYGGHSTDPDDFGGLINWRQTDYCYGNNLAELNN